MRTRRAQKYWAAVKSKPQQEAHAIRHLRNQDVTAYCPQIFNDRARRREPLFPSYLFVELDVGGRWTFINSTHGVLYVLASQDRPCVVPTDAIKAMQAAENKNGVIVLPEQMEFERDQTLLITTGPFKGHEGKFLSYPGPKRVELLLTFLGNLHRVTLPRKSVTARSFDLATPY